MTTLRWTPRSLIAAVIALGLISASAFVTALPARAQSASPSPTPSPSGSGASPSPSASPSPTAPSGPSITLLNPSDSYDPKLDKTGAADPPKVSDKGGPYRLVAWSSVSSNAVVEAAIRRPNQNEETLGLLDPVGEGSWVYEWDIPSTMPAGDATIVVHLYVAGSSGQLEEVAMDEVDVEMRSSAPAVPGADAAPDESLDITWPKVGGPLGFFKPRSGSWRTAISATITAQVRAVEAFYSVSAPGTDPAFIKCGRTGPPTFSLAGQVTADVICTLTGDHLPSQVTAIAAVAEAADPFSQVFDQESAGAASVEPYLQDPETMYVKVGPWVRRLPGACATISIKAFDELDRPVVGANIDVHASGPDDSVIFGSSSASTYKTPEEGHTSAPVTNCVGGAGQPAGKHRFAGAHDESHIESGAGTGVSGPAGVGVNEWRVTMLSNTAGFTKVHAWIDEKSVPDETTLRGIDSDKLEEGEADDVGHFQWYLKTPRVTLDPAGRTALSGTCIPFVVKARSGTQAIAGANIDIHASGPADDLNFCELTDSSTRKGPDIDPTGSEGVHEEDDAGQSHHAGARNAQTGVVAPRTIHTEGETDAAGNFTIGLRSGSVGDSTITAWIDGEPTNNNDSFGSNEASSTGTVTWGSPQPGISFLDPSPYGAAGTGGLGSGTQLPDSGATTTISMRVDTPETPSGVEVLLSSDGKKTFRTLGNATRVAGTDIWNYSWKVDVIDGTYGLRARIAGTQVFADIDVKVGAGDTAPLVANPPYETITLSTPRSGSVASFIRGATKVQGTASAGAEGIDLFYTRIPTTDTPKAADWTFCGYVDLDGMGSVAQSFSGNCTLEGGDLAHQVTGIAAITYDCQAPGCDAQPLPPPVDPLVPATRANGQKDTGDAVRVFGVEASPVLKADPAEAETFVGECLAFQLTLKDQTGEPIGGQNVDLHIPDAGGRVALCSPSGSTTTWRNPVGGEHSLITDPESHPSHANDDGSQTLHVETETAANGRITFGLTGSEALDTTAVLWMDRNDDDVQGTDDPASTLTAHFVDAPRCSIEGTSGDDVLEGTIGADRICGRAGDDIIKGLDGNDLVLGGRGRDRIYGGVGDDLIFSGRGVDNVSGGAGTDDCRGTRRESFRLCE